MSGIDGFQVNVEVNLARGMPMLEIVGLPDASVRAGLVDTVRAANGNRLRPVRIADLSIYGKQQVREGILNIDLTAVPFSGMKRHIVELTGPSFRIYPNSLFAYLLTLQRIATWNLFPDQLIGLFSRYHGIIEPRRLGFPKQWKLLPPGK